MKFEWPWKSHKITLEKDLSTLEKHLASTMKPVEPNPEFLQSLRTQLVGEPERKKFQLKIGSGLRQGLLVAGGIVSFFAMVIGGIRVVASLLDKTSRQPVVEEPISA